MPSGLKRFQKAEALHFITFSCLHRLPLLEAPRVKETFETILEETRARHEARIYAYVLMPEHMHMLINEPPRILLAQFLKSLKQMTSRQLRRQVSQTSAAMHPYSTDAAVPHSSQLYRDEWAGRQFWQARYYDSNIRGEEARSKVIRYIHRNPVKRGLVGRWPRHRPHCFRFRPTLLCPIHRSFIAMSGWDRSKILSCPPD